MANFCNNCGKPLAPGETCDCQTEARYGDLLEMFPREIKPCEDEEKIKAWHVSGLYSKFFRFHKADGVLTVTNKRIIFRTRGVKNEKNFIHSEMPIEHAAGVTVQKGRFFDIISGLIVYWLIGMLFSLPNVLYSVFSGRGVSLFGMRQSNDTGRTVFTIIYWLVVLGFAAYKIYQQRQAAIQAGRIFEIKPVFKRLLTIFWPIKNALTLVIVSKNGGQGIIKIDVPKRFGVLDVSAEQEPDDSIVKLSSILGRIISDVQLYGTADVSEG
ncbi:MAG: hypothetical protein LBR98_00705 [Syntrophomonadaceae bacterium]|jgi:hypothetical protein|nr:hypothetical protein [Syntrophomonadaceae bacterium]